MAEKHLRIVTVKEQIIACELAASDYSLDWRREAQAHRSFVGCTIPEELRACVSSISDALNLGYSSQDWIFDGAKYIFLEANPSGQWLFLPTHSAFKITGKFADWLGEKE